MKGKDPKIAIDNQGNISVWNGLANTTITNIKMVNFENKKSLEKMGDGLYRHIGDPDNEIEASDVRIQQGFLENSNVSSVEEMTEMISTLRIFETYQKMIQSIDTMNDQSVNTIGRVG